MSASEIPNLLTLRGRGGGRGARRGRGRGRGGAGPGAPTFQDRDRLIQETDSDASVSRLSAVVTGWIQKDDFAEEFGACPPNQDPIIKQPIINRGTYVRTECIDRLVHNFLRGKPDQQVQIISLGAGTDTRPFRIWQEEPDIMQRIYYHELDFPPISRKKLTYAKRSNKIESLPMPPQGYYEHFNGVLWDKLALLDPETTSWGFSTPEQGGYMFHPVDLREAARTGIVLDEGKFRTDLPTLIISECCLCYMTAQEADTVIRFFTERIETCGIILYEPTKPNDAFGQMMTSNLAQRGLSMPSIQTYHNLESQMFRLRNLGFNMFQEGANIDFLFLKWIDSQEHVRLQNVQMIDEEEEWKLLAGHYLICWAAKEGEDDDGAFVGWDHLEGEVEAMVKANPVLPQEEHGDGKVYS